MGIRASDAYERFQHLFSGFASERLKQLLEAHHLYQRVSIQPDKIIADLVPPALTPKVIPTNDSQDFFGLVHHFLEKPLTLLPTDGNPFVAVSNIKLYCQKTGMREAHRPVWLEDVTLQLLTKHQQQQRVGIEPDFTISFTGTFQLFILVFQCQTCLGTPESFLVKRDGVDLILEGRSPIEHIELPTFLPRDEKHWFRDAVIAFQTGKVLAALFYLRTFVEQFARRMTGTQNDKKTGDEILSAYADLIPPNLRETMPSLKEWYDNLSAALHGAREDSKLFDTAREKIEEHFDIRRVHKLDFKASRSSDL